MHSCGGPVPPPVYGLSALGNPRHQVVLYLPPTISTSFDAEFTTGHARMALLADGQLVPEVKRKPDLIKEWPEQPFKAMQGDPLPHLSTSRRSCAEEHQWFQVGRIGDADFKPWSRVTSIYLSRTLTLLQKTHITRLITSHAASALTTVEQDVQLELPSNDGLLLLRRARSRCVV